MAATPDTLVFGHLSLNRFLKSRIWRSRDSRCRYIMLGENLSAYIRTCILLRGNQSWAMLRCTVMPAGNSELWPSTGHVETIGTSGFACVHTGVYLSTNYSYFDCLACGWCQRERHIIYIWYVSKCIWVSEESWFPQLCQSLRHIRLGRDFTWTG